MCKESLYTTECLCAESHYAECLGGDCRFAKCPYAEIRYTDCRGATKRIQGNSTKRVLFQGYSKEHCQKGKTQYTIGLQF